MITVERLREVFDYDVVTGVFTRRISTSNRVRVGDRSAGCPNEQGYLRIRLDGRLYRAHHLAWLHVHGEWPKVHIDHIDRNPANNRIKNLREATRSQNLANRPKNKNNSTGYKGVHRLPYDRFQAEIIVERKKINLGTHPTPQLAHAAYVKAARKYFGEFAHA